MPKFVLPRGCDETELTNLLGTAWEIDRGNGRTQRLIVYDTFDWRLYRQSLGLWSVEQTFTLYDLAAARVLTTAVMPEAPVYVWDLPPGLLRARLDPIMGVRALLPQADVLVQTAVYQLLDSAAQPVAELVVEEIRPSAPDDTPLPPASLTVQPLAGQPQVAQEVSEQLAQAGLQASETDTYTAALTAVGQAPGAYSTRLDINLTPDMRADAATKAILRYLFQVMRTNEAYIRQDLDPEFLHDYRVAVRRTRSALSQIKAVFPPDTISRFKQDFKVIGQLSNHLRDLDVYLLSEEDYRNQLPDFLRDALDPMFDHLRQKRAYALREVSEGLKSADYRQMVADWEAFLAGPVGAEKGETAVPRKAATPIISLARRRIYKRYQQVIAAGQVILAENQQGQMHTLRIEGKKLRYLMEFFASLFPPKEMGLLIRQLKQLQSHLGDLNDLNVQQAYLLHIADDLPLRHKKNRRALVAIGWLVANLEQKKTQAKAESAAAFTQFAAAENGRLFAQLFTEGGEGEGVTR